MKPIWIVDDDQSIRFVLEKALLREGLPTRSFTHPRAVIQALICNFQISIESIELAYLIDFRTYFAEELAELDLFRREGLLDISDEWITITPRGRMLVRAICMVFDRYLRVSRQRAGYSRLI